MPQEMAASRHEPPWERSDLWAAQVRFDARCARQLQRLVRRQPKLCLITVSRSLLANERGSREVQSTVAKRRT